MTALDIGLDIDLYRAQSKFVDKDLTFRQKVRKGGRRPEFLLSKDGCH